MRPRRPLQHSPHADKPVRCARRFRACPRCGRAYAVAQPIQLDMGAVWLASGSSRRQCPGCGYAGPRGLARRARRPPGREGRMSCRGPTRSTPVPEEGRRRCAACGAVDPRSAYTPEGPALVAERVCPSGGHAAGVRQFARVLATSGGAR